MACQLQSICRKDSQLIYNMEEQRVEMYFNEGTSDKVYNASLVEVSEGKWNVRITYGRRGNANNESYKLKEHAGYYEASAAYQKVIDAKTKKGYQIGHQS